MATTDQKGQDALQKQNYVTGIKPMADLISLTEEDDDLKAPKIGDVVKGSIVSIDKGKLLVDLGNVYTGVIAGPEVADRQGTAKGIQVGAVIEAVVIDNENEDGQIVLSLRRASQEKAWDQFRKHSEANEAFAVRVTEANKGGLLMEVDGIRGFIPVSQLTPEHYPRVSGADPEKILARLAKLVGQELTVKILSIDDAERRLILSEKAAHAKEREKVMKDLIVGSTIKGRVSGIVKFGIFVNYEGVEGLVHISEIAWGHVSDPSQFARMGDEISVQVIGVEDDKISFSLKRLTPDPWIDAVAKFKVGQMVDGTVARITAFGAFVKLTDEIDGLVHVSEFDGDDMEAVLKPGEAVTAKIISIEPGDHRVGLSLKGMDGKLAPRSDEASDEPKAAAKKTAKKSAAKKTVKKA